MFCFSVSHDSVSYGRKPHNRRWAALLAGQKTRTPPPCHDLHHTAYSALGASHRQQRKSGQADKCFNALCRRDSWLCSPALRLGLSVWARACVWRPARAPRSGPRLFTLHYTLLGREVDPPTCSGGGPRLCVHQARPFLLSVFLFPFPPFTRRQLPGPSRQSDIGARVLGACNGAPDAATLINVLLVHPKDDADNCVPYLCATVQLRSALTGNLPHNLQSTFVLPSEEDLEAVLYITSSASKHHPLSVRRPREPSRFSFIDSVPTGSPRLSSIVPRLPFLKQARPPGGKNLFLIRRSTSHSWVGTKSRSSFFFPVPPFLRSARELPSACKTRNQQLGLSYTFRERKKRRRTKFSSSVRPDGLRLTGMMGQVSFGPESRVCTTCRHARLIEPPQQSGFL